MLVELERDLRLRRRIELADALLCSSKSGLGGLQGLVAFTLLGGPVLPKLP